MKANFFVIGGPISVGKSTLVNSLGFPQVQELDEMNRVQDYILNTTYKKNKSSNEIVEFYFLQMRKRKYEQFSNKLLVRVFDRSIFESLWFAKINLKSNEFTRFKKIMKVWS